MRCPIDDLPYCPSEDSQIIGAIEMRAGRKLQNLVSPFNRWENCQPGEKNESMRNTLVLWVKRQAGLASEHYSALGPKMKDPHTPGLPNDNTLVHSVTLRMDCHCHKPVERKARGENGVTQRWRSECTDNNGNLPAVPRATIVQHGFPQRVYILVKHLQPQFAWFLINRQVDHLSSENFISGTKMN